MEAETAPARMPAHSETAVKREPADASLASSREQDLSPSPALVERYEILSLLGRGGMGVVYRARDRASGEVVAVKVLLERHASAAERFLREAAVLSGLDHPGIVRYGAHGVTEAGEPYLAMEWLDGENLSGRLGRGILTVDETVMLATQVSEALAAAHRLGVVHRDLKPSNLFLVDREIGQVKVLDFGIAYLGGATPMTKTGALLGTPGYMAPEQARSEARLTPAADIFALGCVLFEALAGRPAFEGQNAMTILAKLIFEEAPLLEVHCPDAPPALAALIARMLAKDPAARPADGRALSAELSAFSALRALGGAQTTAAASIRRPHALTEAEQRVVSVVMIRPDDDGALASSGGSLSAELRRAAENAAGRIEHLADGSIAVAFGGAGVPKDQVTLAARFALVIHDLLPPASIALATGRGAPRDTPLLGKAIERAAQRIERARRAAAVGPSRVAIDDTTAALLDVRFEWREGAAGPELLGEREAAETARKLLGKSMPCVGRERELKVLENAFDFCVEERSAQVFLVTAPAGVGKSRLAHELTQSIRRRSPGAAIWLGRGDSMRAGSSLHLVGHALSSALGIKRSDPVAARREQLRTRFQGRGADERRLSEFLGEIVGAPFPEPGSAELDAARRDPRLMAEQTQRAFGDFLRAESEARPLVIILDDLHWGDAASVRFLNIALRDTEARAIFVLGLARPEVHARFPRLWAERGMQELHLSLLSPKASRRLVGAALGEGCAGEAMARLVALSDGNAFYLEELIRAAAAGEAGEEAHALPETVVAMVQARLEGLDPDARRVLRAASLYGEVFWSGGVVALLGDMRSKQATDRLSRLCAQEVLVRRQDSRFLGEEELAFRHALLREGAYAMLTENDRSLGHRLAGQWLEEHGESDALALAEHFERGEDRGRAAQHYLRAADRASEADDADAVLSCVERGLGCDPAGELRAALLSLKAGVLLGREQYAESIALATEALDGLPAGGRRWYLTFVTLHATVAVSQPGALMNLARRFLDVMPSPEARDEYLQAAVWLHIMLAILGEKGVAHELLLQMRREGVHISKDDASAWGYLQGAEANHHHYIEEAPWSCMRANADAARSLAQAGRWDRGISATVYGKALTDLGAHDGAASVLQESLVLAERRRDAFSLALVRVYLARLLARIALLDRLAEPEHLARAVIAAGNPMMVGLAHGVLAQLAVRRSDLATAEVEARMACERVRPFPTYSWDITALRVQILLSLGRAQEALDAGEQALERLSRLGVSGFGEIDLRLAVAEARGAMGRTEEGRTLLRETLRGLRRRVADLPSAEARARYLTAVPTHARLLSVAREWLGDEALRDAGLIVEGR
jgi:tetratricopeptide (TPR) repeat protein